MVGGDKTKHAQTVRIRLVTGAAPSSGPWLQVAAGETKKLADAILSSRLANAKFS